jgi:3-dehydroquinate synthase
MAESSAATVIHVGGASPYDVVVGRDLAGRLPFVLGTSVQRVAVISPVSLDELVDPIVAVLEGSYEVVRLPVPDGEHAKTTTVADLCWGALGNAGFTRSDAVVAVGGGATTDLGGFVAATWLRGVRVVHVPTTLLGMVDAAVGGKTGINTNAGKNLVGAFHEPAGVLCDLDLLETLPGEELVSGLAEVVKCGFVADPEILRLVEGSAPGELTSASPVLRELVERAIRVKVDVVVVDLKETGGRDGHPGREVLNYGHTLGHAIERVEDYGIRHGEAVAIGCVYAAELARLGGRMSPELAERHRSALARVGLPTSYSGADFETLLAAMRVDKKTRGSDLRFVVLEDLAAPTVLAAPAEELLRAAYDAISEPAGGPR